MYPHPLHIICERPHIHIVGHDVVGYCAKLTGEAMSRYLNKIESVALRKAKSFVRCDCECCSSKFFSVHVVQLWNNLPEEVVSATCVSAFKSCLNSMHVSFLTLCFCTVIYFWGSCKCSLSLSVQLTQFCFLLYFIVLCCFCIVSVLTNKLYIG